MQSKKPQLSPKGLAALLATLVLVWATRKKGRKGKTHNPVLRIAGWLGIFLGFALFYFIVYFLGIFIATADPVTTLGIFAFIVTGSFFSELGNKLPTALDRRFFVRVFFRTVGWATLVLGAALFLEHLGTITIS